jgi:hypothetical protein
MGRARWVSMERILLTKPTGSISLDERRTLLMYPACPQVERGQWRVRKASNRLARKSLV